MSRRSWVLLAAAALTLNSLLVPAVAAAAVPTAAVAPLAVTAAGGFTAVAPTRVLDTRTGNGAAKAKVASGASVAVQVDGRAGVPAAGVSAVVVNVTVTNPSAHGFITGYADGATAPTTSVVNFVAGQTVPNAAVIPVGSDGRIRLTNSSGGTVDLLVDVSGYFLAGTVTSAGGFAAVAPARVLDTRTGNGAAKAKVASGASVSVQVDGRAGLPAAGVSAVVVNVTVTNPAAHGYITAYADGSTAPSTSTVNFVANQTVPNAAVIPVGADGRIKLTNNSGGTVDLLVDVSGYFRAGTVTVAGGFTAVAPTRVLDTRTGNGAAKAKVASGASVAVQVDGRAGVPAAGVSAVVVNVTVTNPSAHGFITGYADGATAPTTSVVNFVAGQTVPNAAVIPVGSDGKIRLTNSSGGTVDLLVDVSGYFLAAGTGTTVGGLTFGAPVTVDPQQGGVNATSCASPTFCAAVDESGTVLTFDGSTWTVPVRIDDSNLYGVSCPSATWCVAVDSIGRFTRYDGSAWTAPVRVDTHLNLQSVSCPTTTFCAAVDLAGYALTYNGTSWSTPVQADANGLRSVSCVSANFCVAVGYDGQASVYRGAGWSTPTDAQTFSQSFVSCASPTFCIAVGGFGSAGRFDGTTWTDVSSAADTLTSVACTAPTFCVAGDVTGHVVTFTGAHFSSPALVDTNKQLDSLACASSSFCVGVDVPGNAVTYRGSGWSAPVPVDAAGGSLDSVSCGSSSRCVAVAYSSAATFDGSAWSRPSVIAVNDGGHLLQAVSCPTAASCVAVDGGTQGFARTYDGTSWSAPTLIESGDGDLSGLSCASPTFCMAVDDFSGDAIRFNGTSWTASPIGGQSDLDGVSCVSSSFCVAIARSGLASVYRGASWTAPASVDANQDLESVSCASPTFCVAVDDAGAAIRFNGTGWTAPAQIDAGRELTAVSCPTSTFCAAVDSEGYLLTFNGSSWSTPGHVLTVDADHPAGSTGVSCPTASFCAVVDGNGRAVTGHA